MSRANYQDLEKEEPQHFASKEAAFAHALKVILKETRAEELAIVENMSQWTSGDWQADWITASNAVAHLTEWWGSLLPADFARQLLPALVQ